MEHQEQNDPLWKLLSHARRTEPTPFFARNVVRELRHLESKPNRLRDRLIHWLSPRVLIAGTGACAAIALTLIAISESPRSSADGTEVKIASLANQDLETFDPASEMASIEYFGQLMAVADPGQLDDAALAHLFY